VGGGEAQKPASRSEFEKEGLDERQGTGSRPSGQGNGNRRSKAARASKRAPVLKVGRAQKKGVFSKKKTSHARPQKEKGRKALGRDTRGAPY